MTHTVQVQETSRPSLPLIDPLYAEIGGRILATRKRANLRQEKLAEAVQLSRTSITNIERGRQKIQVDTLYAIAEVLGVRPHALLPLPNQPMSETLQEGLSESLPPDEAQWIRRIVR